MQNTIQFAKGTTTIFALIVFDLHASDRSLTCGTPQAQTKTMSPRATWPGAVRWPYPMQIASFDDYRSHKPSSVQIMVLGRRYWLEQTRCSKTGCLKTRQRNQYTPAQELMSEDLASSTKDSTRIEPSQMSKAVLWQSRVRQVQAADKTRRERSNASKAERTDN